MCILRVRLSWGLQGSPPFLSLCVSSTPPTTTTTQSYELRTGSNNKHFGPPTNTHIIHTYIYHYTRTHTHTRLSRRDGIGSNRVAYIWFSSLIREQQTPRDLSPLSISWATLGDDSQLLCGGWLHVGRRALWGCKIRDRRENRRTNFETFLGAYTVVHTRVSCVWVRQAAWVEDWVVSEKKQ